jgi:hypothetical protein
MRRKTRSGEVQPQSKTLTSPGLCRALGLDSATLTSASPTSLAPFFGLASSGTIGLHDNAAGSGWFIDPTPWDDSEFVLRGDQCEQNCIDFLTVDISDTCSSTITTRKP